MKKFLYMMCLGIVGFASCSEEELKRPDSSLWEVAQTEQTGGPQLKVEEDFVGVIKSETKQVQIVEGAGEYRVMVLDPDIVEASVEGNTIIVKGKNYGQTEIVVSDKEGHYKNIRLDVYKTDRLELASEQLDLALPFGKPSESILDIISGNGGYTLSSSDKDVVTVALAADNPERIVISAKSAGKAEITVTDYKGLSAKVQVNVTVTDTPFTEQQIEAIKSETEVKYMLGTDNYWNLIDSSVRQTLSGSGFSFDFVHYNPGYGIQYRGRQYYLLVVTFDKKIDYTLGKKEGGKLYVKNNKVFILQGVDCTFEVIQHKDGKVWATFYHVDQKSGDVYSGYMIFKE